jgi:hypothetical protein
MPQRPARAASEQEKLQNMEPKSDILSAESLAAIDTLEAWFARPRSSRAANYKFPEGEFTAAGYAQSEGISYSAARARIFQARADRIVEAFGLKDRQTIYVVTANRPQIEQAREREFAESRTK